MSIIPGTLAKTAAKRCEQILHEMHQLSLQDQADSPGYMRLCDELTEYWLFTHEIDQERLRQLSEDLYHEEEEERASRSKTE